MKNSPLLQLSSWVTKRNLGFYVISFGMIVMLIWAGSFKMTTPGADGITPLVTNSPLISWHFKVFGAYIGSDLIGLTEWICAVFITIGLFKPKAGIVGGAIGVVIFFVTSSMLLTTPDAIIHINGMAYMNNLGLFLFKDVISLGACLYLISFFGKRAASTN